MVENLSTQDVMYHATAFCVVILSTLAFVIDLGSRNERFGPKEEDFAIKMFSGVRLFRTTTKVFDVQSGCGN